MVLLMVNLESVMLHVVVLLLRLQFHEYVDHRMVRLLHLYQWWISVMLVHRQQYLDQALGHGHVQVSMVEQIVQSVVRIHSLPQWMESVVVLFHEKYDYHLRTVHVI